VNNPENNHALVRRRRPKGQKHSVVSSAIGEQLALLEANELHLKFHGADYDFKAILEGLVMKHLGLVYTPPPKADRDANLSRRLQQKQLRSTPEWQAAKKTKRSEERAKKAKTPATKEAETGSSGAYQPGGYHRPTGVEADGADFLGENGGLLAGGGEPGSDNEGGD